MGRNSARACSHRVRSSFARCPSLLVRGGALVVLSASLVTTGCLGGGGSSAGSEAPSQPFVVVDPEDARLVTASSVLAERVGHPLSYTIDPALVGEHEPRIRELVAGALETVVLAVARARDEAPEEAARACLVFSKLKVERDERARNPFAVFEPQTGTLVLHVPTAAVAFADEERVTDALLSAYSP